MDSKGQPSTPRGSQNKQTEPKDSTPTSSGGSWQQVTPGRQRLKISESRQQKRAAQRAAPKLPALEIVDQHQTPAYPEKLTQRRPGKGKKAVPWQSEQEQIAELGNRLQRLGPRSGHSGGQQSQDIWAPRNPLVSKYENEKTDHCAQEWRRVPDVPTPEELLGQDVGVPTNIIDGPFPSVEEYLQTHYELVREDTLSGLRAAVAHMQRSPESDDTQDIAVYENVELLGLTFSPAHGVCSKVSFSLNRAGKRVRWEQSKRLVSGTLVCLSQDNFETFKVATVAARPLSGLEVNPPEVDLLFHPDDLEIDVSRPFLMVESRNGYFEAYKWVLRAMQRMNEDNMALKEHIVMLDKDVGPPAYLQENPIYNLSGICSDDAEKEPLEEVDILTQWPRKVKSSMDKSQIDALRAILTKRVAVVQGPPGTGKTYTSVMALTTLLRNMAEGDPPVVVACQTNHALDQLLRHVYQFEPDIIRLGGRTQDREDIKKRTIFNIRRASGVKIQGCAPYTIIKELDSIRNQICEALAPLAADLISPDALFELKLINKKQQESFAAGVKDWVQAQGENKPGSPIATWLLDSLMPARKVEDIYLETEDPEIEYEGLQDLEAEFVGVNTDDDEFKEELRGFWYRIQHDYRVHSPDGVTDDEIARALRTQDVWRLPDHTRAAVYRHWEIAATTKIREKLRTLGREFQRLVQDLKVARMEKDAYLISRCKLVGMTTTGLSKYRTIIAACKPKIILIEEAAECLEAPVLVGCLPTIQHMILVGDHKQLKGKCNERDLQGDPYYLDVSMFERWVSNDMPYSPLRTQRRMRPEIREILEPIYGNQLKDHPSVVGRDPVQGMGDVNMFWYSHTNHEDVMPDTPSKINPYEADMVAKFIEYLVLNGAETDNITVLTFYTGQRELIRRKLRQNPNFVSVRFKINTVDSFQGEENDIIILSLVRSNRDGRDGQGKIGFLDNANRVCVALSRAQRGFYIFGNASMITQDQLWWDVAAILNRPPVRIGTSLPLTCLRHKERTLIEGLSDWMDLKGGCIKPCKERMPCGHDCPLRCHAFDHSQYRCMDPCRKINPNCGHQCSKACWEDCWCTVCGLSARKAPAAADSGDEEEENEAKSKAANGKAGKAGRAGRAGKAGKEAAAKESDQPQVLGFGGVPRPPDKAQRRGHGQFKYSDAVGKKK